MYWNCITLVHYHALVNHWHMDKFLRNKFIYHVIHNFFTYNLLSRWSMDSLRIQSSSISFFGSSNIPFISSFFSSFPHFLLILKFWRSYSSIYLIYFLYFHIFPVLLERDMLVIHIQSQGITICWIISFLVIAIMFSFQIWPRLMRCVFK